MKLGEWVRSPKSKRLAIILVSALLLFVVIGFFVAPPILKSVLMKELSLKLHRPVEIAAIEINPIALSATVRGFAVKERAGQETALGFDELYLNISSLSIFRLKPVVSEVRLAGPTLRVVRNAEGKYNFGDLIEEFMKPSNEPTPQFSVSNIQVSGGRIEFDDLPKGKKHLVSDIQVGLPFISNFPSEVQSFVQPAFSARVNGAPVAIAGKSKPFIDSEDTVVEFDLNDLDVPTYAGYSPVEIPAKFVSGKLFAKLALSFVHHPKAGNSVSLSGVAGLRDFVLTEPDGKPSVNLPLLEVGIGAIQYPARRVTIDRVLFKTPELFITRTERGRIYLIDLLQAAQGGPGQAGDKGAPKVNFELKELRIENGTYHITDASYHRPMEIEYKELSATLRNFSNAPDAVAQAQISTTSNLADAVKIESEIRIAPISLAGTVEIKRMHVPALMPVLEETTLVDVLDGAADLSTRFKVDETEKGWQVLLSGLAASVESLALKQHGEKQPFLQLPQFALSETDLDLAERSLSIGTLATQGAKILVKRARDGKMNLASLAREGAKAESAPAQAGPAWKIALKSAEIKGYALRFEDASLPTPVVVSAGPIDLKASDFSTEKGAKTSIEARIGLGKRGSLSASGPIVIDPLSASLKVNARGLDIVPLQPYFGGRLNIVISSGALGANGTLGVERKGEALRIAYKGSASVNDFASVDKANSTDFLKWKSFFFGGVDAVSEPLAVAIKEVSLTDFYSRLIISPEGRFNLQDILVKSSAEDTAQPAADKSVQPAAAPGPRASPNEPSKPGPALPKVRIDTVTLQGGNVNFNDHFIKPNYSANLTDLGGRVSGLSSEPGTTAEVELAGRVDSAAPVEIKGRINPLAQELFLDVAANVTGIELTGLTAYSQRYVGYGIEKGKLSVKVKYLVENRKLSAENSVYLDQLTFGEKVESPDATKLPVLLAVALLKDSRGVIDINLPVSGSLDDPQFSVGGIIIRVIINLITKAITAPFSLLAAAFGGGGEELSYLDFDDGSAALSPDSEAKLKKISQAFKDRPGLKLDVAGTADKVNDTEGLKHRRLEQKVKAEKLKDLVAKGESVGSVAEVKVDEQEYPKYLKRVYGEEKFPKPRNLIGFAKDLPVPEMEKLIITNTTVTDDDLAKLAADRAQAVKGYLTGPGQISQERVFIVASVSRSQEAKDKAKGSRVDLAIK